MIRSPARRSLINQNGSESTPERPSMCPRRVLRLGVCVCVCVCGQECRLRTHTMAGGYGYPLVDCRLCNGSGRKVCCLLSGVRVSISVSVSERNVCVRVCVGEWGEAPSLGHTCAIVCSDSHHPTMAETIVDPLGKPSLVLIQIQVHALLGAFKIKHSAHLQWSKWNDWRQHIAYCISLSPGGNWPNTNTILATYQPPMYLCPQLHPECDSTAGCLGSGGEPF